MKTKTYTINVYGCQMNKSDSERLKAVLDRIGLTCIQDDMKADFVFMVACSVRQPAVDSIYTRYSNLKKKRKDSFYTCLTGCLLPEDKEKLSKKYDLVFNIKDLVFLQTQIENLVNNSNFGIKEYKDYFTVNPKYSKKFSVDIPIMTGCDNYCSYCVVPYTRGREKSRLISEVIKEAKTAVSNGAVFITLLGQNVNSYNPDDKNNFSHDNIYKNNNFSALLWELNKINGLQWINFSSSHPKDLDDELINALTLPKMVNYLHLPAQSGDDEVLKRMNRKYTARDFILLIEKVKNKKPDIAIGTDLIIGFCGESEKEFKNTVNFYKKINFDISYNSKYYSRKGTYAYQNYDDNVTLEIKKKRWFYMQDLMEKIAFKKNQKYKGKNIEVLVNDYDIKTKIASGISRELKFVKFHSDKDFTGKIITVEVEDAKTWILTGKNN